LDDFAEHFSVDILILLLSLDDVIKITVLPCT